MMAYIKGDLLNKFRKFWTSLEKFFIPTYAWNSNPLTFWRERILFALCFVTAVIAPFALVPSLILAFHEKLWDVMVIDTLAYLAMVSVLFLSHLPLKLRGGIACFILYALGMTLSFILGPEGAGFIWLFGASILISAMIGPVGAFWMLFANAATLLTIAAFIAGGSLDWALRMENPLQKWLVTTANFLFLNTFVTVATSFMLNGLKRALIKEQKNSNHLRRSEERYRHAHERFLTVLNSIEAFIYVADVETREILFMNKSMIEHFKQDMTGRLCWKSLKGESGPCSDCTIDRLTEGQDASTDVHIWEEHNQTTQKWYVNHDRAIKWIDGRTAKIQIATDVTELKRLEKELRQSQKMEAIGTLAGGIAHDFNNILSSIIGFTELAVEDVEQGTLVEDNLQEVLIASNRAKDLVKNILAFARQSDQELKPIQIGPIAKEALKLIRSAIPASIEIQSQISSRSLIMGNPTEIHQILMNLCTNAAHAMADTTGTLKVTLTDERILQKIAAVHSELDCGDYLKLSISDTGTGIDPNTINSIFEPYFTTKPQGEGTGIGLAMVHGIVESYGGKIVVESEPGRGTSFHIYLPVAKKSAQTDQQLRQDIPTGTERILVVDDESAIAKMADRTLSKLGYNVVTRTSSIEALELFQNKPDAFELVITDFAMPNMTGETLAMELMRIRKEIPIILCTGYSKSVSEESVREIGIKAFIHKPIVQAELARTIRRVLDHQSESTDSSLHGL